MTPECQASPGARQGTYSCLTLDTWKDHYTVEHVAPQAALPGDTSYETAIYDQGLTDRLGNLTLMPEELNQLVGNKSWPAKRDLYKILSEVSPQERVNQLQTNLGSVAQTTKQVLESAAYLPFCEAISKFPDAVLSAAFLSSRGERLASLAWDRIWPHLS